jgi:hypothetical protein
MWARCSELLLGAALMAAPQVFGYFGPLATSDRASGALAASIAILAMGGTTCGIRWLLVPLAAWVMLAPGVFDQLHEPRLLGLRLMVGAALVLFSRVPTRTRARRGGGLRAVLHPIRVVSGRSSHLRRP